MSGNNHDTRILSLSISLASALLLSVYVSMSNSVIGQSTYNNIFSEDSERENFLARMEQNFQQKIDPKVAEKIAQGTQELEEALNKGKRLFITADALSFLANHVKNANGNSRALVDEVTSSPPSTINWEFPGDIQVSGLPDVQTEPDIVSSEINDGNLAALITDYSDTLRCRLASSTNAGASWTDRGNMQLPTGTSFQGDPVLATNSKGHFIATCLAWDTDDIGDSTSSAIIMQTSTDKGVTWGSRTIVVGSTSDISPVFHDKPWIASDPNVHSPYRDRTYMCWTKFDAPLGTSKIIVKRIQASIGPEKTLITSGQDPDNIVQGCNIAVGPRGEVAVAWYNARGTDPSTQGRIMISRSYDGGGSWTSGKTIATLTKIPPCSDGFYGCLDGQGGQFRVNQFPEITWDRLDHLLITYTDYTSGNPDIRFTSSSNCATPSGACTFNSPIKVNDDGTARDQFFPAIVASDKITSVDDRGVVHIVAQDKREDSSNLFWRPWSYHCNLSSGCDTSGEWSGSNPQTGISSELFSNEGLNSNFFVGDYNGLTTGDGVVNSPSLNRQAHAIWFDNVGGIRDIYSDRTTN